MGVSWRFPYVLLGFPMKNSSIYWGYPGSTEPGCKVPQSWWKMMRTVDNGRNYEVVHH
jgi:hypothetical protein